MEGLYADIRRMATMTTDEIADIMERFDRIRPDQMDQHRAHYLVRKMLTITRSLICLQGVINPMTEMPVGVNLESNIEEILEREQILGGQASPRRTPSPDIMEMECEAGASPEERPETPPPSETNEINRDEDQGATASGLEEIWSASEYVVKQEK